MGWQADPKMYCSICTCLIPRLNTIKTIFFYSDPLPDLRPDLEASRYPAFAYPGMCLVFNNSKKPQSYGVL